MLPLNLIETEIPPLNDMSKGLRTIANASISAVVLQVEAIDAQLEQINIFLSRLQPWKTGRVGVTCENTKRCLTVPRPKLFRWNSKLQKWSYLRRGGPRLAQRVKTARAFHQNREVVKELATMVTYLMALRASLVTAITNFEKAVNGRMARAAKMSEFADRFLALQTEISAGKHCTDFGDWYADDDQ